MDLPFAVLSFVAVLFGLWVLSAMRLPPESTLRVWTARLVLPAAASIATTSAAGSLYYSESLGYLPCELCWYQRIGMYSLAIILSLAVLRKDRAIAPYGLALAGAGFVVSAYHYWIQMFPADSSCSTDVPCSIRWVEEFGFVTMPFMALAGFFAIGASMIYLRKVVAE